MGAEKRKASSAKKEKKNYIGKSWEKMKMLTR
jgi:hypothetical protein